MAPLQGPFGLFTVSVLPRFLCDSTRPGWRGAFFVHYHSAARGDALHVHRNFAWQRHLAPLRVRRHATRTWLTLPPSIGLWRPGEEQFSTWENSVPGQFLFVAPERVKEILDGQTPCFHTRSGREPVMSPLAYRLFDSLALDLQDGSPAGSIVGDALTTALVAHMATLRPAGGPARFGAATQRRVVEYVAVHLHDDLALHRLAAEAGVSVRQFSRVFRATFGVSPHQYIVQQRIERAKTLILAGMPFARVGLECGFGDQSVFSRTFTRIAGRTPTAFRAQGRVSAKPR